MGFNEIILWKLVLYKIVTAMTSGIALICVFFIVESLKEVISNKIYIWGLRRNK